MVIKDKLCNTTNAKFAMVAAMLYGDLMDTWAEHVNKVTSELQTKKHMDGNGVEVEFE